MSDHDIDLHLEGLAHRTAGIVPRANFNARVMGAIQDEAAPVSTGFASGTWRMGWRALPMAALLASVALFLAVKSASLYDDALVGAYDDSSVELGW
jgi:hypothetical protein